MLSNRVAPNFTLRSAIERCMKDRQQQRDEDISTSDLELAIKLREEDLCSKNEKQLADLNSITLQLSQLGTPKFALSETELDLQMLKKMERFSPGVPAV